MIRHIVMWKFLDNAEGKTKAENIEIFKKGLEKLPPCIPEILKFEIGVNVAEGGYDLVLCSEFKNRTNLEIYRNSPEHRKVADFGAKVRESRATVDYEL